MVNGKGNFSHSGHLCVSDQASIFPARLLDDAERRITESIIRADAKNGVIQNVVNKRNGLALTRHNCYYLSKLTSAIEGIDCLKELSSSDKLLQFLKDKKYEYLSLFSQDSNFSDHTVLVTDNYVSSKSLFCNTDYILPPNELADASKFSNEHRKKMNLTHEQNLLLAVAWVIPGEKDYFFLFPEVLFIDIVEKTNNEKRPLLVVSGKDSDGKMFTILRAFLPNQRSWIFRWIFSVVFPTMFSKDLLKRVKIIISDGDSHEYQQIDIAINKYLINAKRLRCGWHLVDRGWFNYGPCYQKAGPYELKNFLEVKRNIQSWMYSWMKSNCETLREYNISKYLFFKYIYSTNVENKVGLSFIKMVKNLIINHLYNVEEHYPFYQRIGIRHFDDYSNSCHEGTNHGIKYNTAPVGPLLNLEHATCILSKNGERKRKQRDKKASIDAIKTETWSSLKCSKHLLRRCSILLSDQWSLRSNYQNQRISLNEWKVLYKYTGDEKYHTIVPVFKRLRTVKYSNHHLTCDCCHFERHGIPCRHIYNVLSSFDDYDEPSHHDVAIRYWRKYLFYPPYLNHDHRYHGEIPKLMGLLRDHDTQGPSCERSLFDSIVINPVLPTNFQFTEPCCLNYNFATISMESNLDVEDIISQDDIPLGTGMSMSQNTNRLQGDESAITCDSHLNEHFQMLSNEVQNQRRVLHPKDVYKELMPVCKELFSALELECSVIEIDRIKEILTVETASAKANFLSNHPRSQRGRMVSSHVPSCSTRNSSVYD